MCSLSLEIARVTQLLLDVVDKTVVSGMAIVRGTCRQDCQDGIPCCPDLCCLIILPFHLVQNEQMKQNIFISSSFCLKTKDDVSSLRLPSEHCLIQATVLLKLVGVAPCSGEVLKYFTEVVGTLYKSKAQREELPSNHSAREREYGLVDSDSIVAQC